MALTESEELELLELERERSFVKKPSVMERLGLTAEWHGPIEATKNVLGRIGQVAGAAERAITAPTDYLQGLAGIPPYRTGQEYIAGQARRVPVVGEALSQLGNMITSPLMFVPPLKAAGIAGFKKAADFVKAAPVSAAKGPGIFTRAAAKVSGVSPDALNDIVKTKGLYGEVQDAVKNGREIAGDLNAAIKAHKITADEAFKAASARVEDNFAKSVAIHDKPEAFAIGQKLKEVIDQKAFSEIEQQAVNQTLYKMPEVDLSPTITALDNQISGAIKFGTEEKVIGRLEKLKKQLMDLREPGKVAGPGKDYTLWDYAQKNKVSSESLAPYIGSRRGELGDFIRIKSGKGLNETEFAQKFAEDYPEYAHSLGIVDDAGVVRETGNLMEMLADPLSAKKIALRSTRDQYGEMAGRFEPNVPVTASKFKEMREILDSEIDWASPEAGRLDARLKPVRAAMEGQLRQVAEDMGDPIYKAAMESWAKKLQMSGEMKRLLGNNPENFVNGLLQRGMKGSREKIKQLDKMTNGQFTKSVKDLYYDRLISRAIDPKTGQISAARLGNAINEPQTVELMGEILGPGEVSRVRGAVEKYRREISGVAESYLKKTGGKGEKFGIREYMSEELPNIANKTGRSQRNMAELNLIDDLLGRTGKDRFSYQVNLLHTGKGLGLTESSTRLGYIPEHKTGALTVGVLVGGSGGSFVGGGPGAVIGSVLGLYAASPAAAYRVLTIARSPVTRTIARTGVAAGAVGGVGYGAMKIGENRKKQVGNMRSK